MTTISTNHNGAFYVSFVNSGVSYLYKWNGFTWNNMVIPFTLGDPTCLISFKGDLYLFNSSQNILKFDGTNWTSISIPGMSGTFWEAVVHNNEMIIVGGFSSGPSNGAIKYDGVNFINMPALPINANHYNVNVLNNEIFVGGYAGSINSFPSVLKKLVGTTWVNAANYYTGPNHPTNATVRIIIYQGDLYVQGSSNNLVAGAPRQLFKLSNDTLIDMGDVGCYIKDYAIFNNELYIVGQDSLFGDHLKKFNGINIQAIPNTPVLLTGVDSVNGELFLIGGSDTLYNGVTHNYAYRTSPNYSVLNGTVYNDVNGDCFQNPLETGIKGVIIPLVNQAGASSGNKGFYSVSVPPGSYTFGQIYSPLPVNKNLNSICSLPNPITIGANQTLTQNIAMKNTVAKDLVLTIEGYQGWRAKHGFSEAYNISLGNAGNATVSNAEFKLVVPPTVTIDSIVPAASSNTGTTYTFNMLNLNSMETREVKLYATINTTSNSLGDSLSWNVNTINFSGDADPSDNAMTLKQVVVASFDPNDKQASAYRILPGTNKIDYHIRFQNTGTDTAYKVVVVDTLDMNLPLTNVMINSTSHPYSLSIAGNVLIWTFDNILLPDSGANYLGSQGYVNFSTGINTGLAIGDTIQNKAEIYFDFQKPIITNHAKTAVVQWISVEEYSSKYLELKVYPNPAKDFVIVENTSKEAQILSITDMQGRIVRKITLAPDNETQISINDLSVGTYILNAVESRYKLIITQ